MPVTIALAVAILFGLVALHQSVVIPSSRWRAQRIWQGLASASWLLVVTLALAWLFVHFVVSLSEDQRAAQTLLRLEARLDWLDQIQRGLFGHWSWRLALGIVLLAVAGVVFAQAANQVRRVIWTADRIRFAGTIVSILASLTITSAPLEMAVGRAELRIAETQRQVAANADIVRRHVEEAVVAAAFAEAERARQDECDRDPAACLEAFDRDSVPPARTTLEDVPALATLWQGAGVRRATAPAARADRPVSAYAAAIGAMSIESSDKLVARVEGESVRQRAETTSALTDTIGQELFGVAADAGFDAMLAAARQAGIEGQIVEAAAAPLVSDAFQETLALLVEEATRAVLGGNELGAVIANAVRPRLRAMFASADARAATVSATGRLNAILRDAQARGEPLIAPWRRRQEAEIRAAQESAATGGAPGPDFNPPAFDPGSVWSGRAAPGPRPKPPIFRGR